MTQRIKYEEIPQPKGLEKINITPVKTPNQLLYLEKYYKKSDAGSFELKDYLRLAWDSIHQFMFRKAGYIEDNSKPLWAIALEVILEIIKGMFKRGTN